MHSTCFISSSNKLILVGIDHILTFSYFKSCINICMINMHTILIGAFEYLAASLSRLTNLVTFIATAAHHLTTGDTVLVSGATPSTFNGLHVVTVTDPFTFTYVNFLYAFSSSPPYAVLGWVPLDLEARVTMGM